MVPLIGIGGPAGSGKTTLANAVAHYHNAAIVSFADPMKRLLARVFEWPADLLWGPSAAKDRSIPMTMKERLDAVYRFIDCRQEWAQRELPFLPQGEIDPLGIGPTVTEILQEWWNNDVVGMMECGELSPRAAMHSLGTDRFRRRFGPRVWVDPTMATVNALLDGGYRYEAAHGLFRATETQEPAWVVVADCRYRNEYGAILRAGGQTWRLNAPTTDTHAAETSSALVPSSFITREIIDVPLERMASYAFANPKR